MAEGDLADLPVIDDCGDLSKAEPSLLENFRVQAPNGVSVGTTDPGDAVLVRQYGGVPSSLSWAIGSRSKVALIAYQHKDTLTGGDASTVKENSRLQLLTGQNRFELDEAQAQVKVLGRVGDSDYYKVAYVIEETRRYDTLLRAVFPVCAKGTDIAVTTLRGTAGSEAILIRPGSPASTTPARTIRWYTISRAWPSSCMKKSPGTAFSPTTGPSSRMGTWIGCSRPARPWITPLSGKWRRAPV